MKRKEIIIKVEAIEILDTYGEEVPMIREIMALTNKGTEIFDNELTLKVGDIVNVEINIEEEE